MTAAGIGTSLLVVAVNFLVARAVNVDFLSLSFWFVFPAGALIGGCGAASGYYLVAQATHVMPTKRLLFNMVSVACSTWFLSKWLDYATLTLGDGSRARDVVSFWQYFAATTEHMRLTISTRYNPSLGNTGDLGDWGYVREAVALVGFMAGGLWTYSTLEAKEACQQCRRYTQVEVLLNGADAKAFDFTLATAGIDLPGLVDQAVAVLGQRSLAGMYLAILRCERCGTEWVRPALVVRSGRSFVQERLMRYTLSGDASSRLREAATRAVPPQTSEMQRPNQRL
jgi:hypothetical protein